LEFWAGPQIRALVGKDLTIDSVQRALAFGREDQEKSVDEDAGPRLLVLDDLGRRWRQFLDSSQSEALIEKLSSQTGYCDRMVRIDLEFVSTLLNAKMIRQALNNSLPGGLESLGSFLKSGNEELYRCRPAGPVLTIGSGNSVLPVLISATTALATGNFTIVRPSASNKEAVFQVLSMLEEIGDKETPLAPAARRMSNSCVVFYEQAGGSLLRFLMEKAAIGVVNFWGADPALSEVSKMVSSNMNHPHLSLLGPLAGYAVVDKDAELEEAAISLAEGITYYDQQLCSSPTEACFIGDLNQAKHFAENVGKKLEQMTKQFPIVKAEYEIHLLQSARNLLKAKGSELIVPSDGGPEWTLAVSEEKSNLDAAVKDIPEFLLHARRRFLEIIAVKNQGDVLEKIRALPDREPFRGVLRVQTVGLAATRERFEALSSLLYCSKAYRIVPLKDMHIRSPLEPFDGRHLARDFVDIIYIRKQTGAPSAL
jgi:hypothetical protein